MKKKHVLLGAGLAAIGLAACAPTGLDKGFGVDGVKISPLSTEGTDRYLSAANGPDGSVYAGGFTTVSGNDQAFAVARHLPNGDLDPTFGTGGVAVANVVVGGGTLENARTVAVQSDGKVLISGTADHELGGTGDARDTDVFIARFNTDGTADTTYGTNGIARVDIGTGRVVGTAFQADSVWGLGVTADDGAVFWGSSPSTTGTDTDWVLGKVTSAGVVDSTFGTNGFTRSGVAGVNDNPRNLIVQSDGKIVTAGYSTPAGGVLQPFLHRFNADGSFDTSFDTDGVANFPVLAGQSEAYGVRQHNGGYVASGYGRGPDVNEAVDQIIYRFNADGSFDSTFNGGTGVVRFDVAGLADRARQIEVLPDGRILTPGSATSSAAVTGPPAVPANVDGFVTLLSATGQPDAYFGTGGKVVSELGGPNDAWFGSVLSADGTTVWLTGYKGVAGTVGAINNDDAAIAKIDLRR